MRGCAVGPGAAGHPGHDLRARGGRGGPIRRRQRRRCCSRPVSGGGCGSGGLRGRPIYRSGGRRNRRVFVSGGRNRGRDTAAPGPGRVDKDRDQQQDRQEVITPGSVRVMLIDQRGLAERSQAAGDQPTPPTSRRPEGRQAPARRCGGRLNPRVRLPRRDHALAAPSFRLAGHPFRVATGRGPIPGSPTGEERVKGLPIGRESGPDCLARRARQCGANTVALQV
jgi:hypothetical protein